jgi:hypothetical protein
MTVQPSSLITPLDVEQEFSVGTILIIHGRNPSKTGNRNKSNQSKNGSKIWVGAIQSIFRRRL